MWGLNSRPWDQELHVPLNEPARCPKCEFLFFYFFKSFYSTEIETASERGNTSRGSGRGRSRLIVEERRNLMWGSIPERRDHALSRRQTLNCCATQAPRDWIFFSQVSVLAFSPTIPSSNSLILSSAPFTLAIRASSFDCIWFIAFLISARFPLIFTLRDSIFSLIFSLIFFFKPTHHLDHCYSELLFWQFGYVHIH